jgi:precorrin-6Y C5,15-methyltransferase (decarboxylating)
MNVTIIGTGLADGGTITVAGQEAIDRCDLVVGAKRLLEALPETCTAERVAAAIPRDVIEAIAKHLDTAQDVAVLMSGDTGFYSGTTKLVEALRHAHLDPVVIPGISSIQALSARLGEPWQDWRLVSAHGRECDPAAWVRDNAKTFFLTGGDLPVHVLAARLEDAGFGECRAVAGERLGSPEERVVDATVEELMVKSFDDLAVLLVENPSPRTAVSVGIADDEFVRGKAPMTKSEVRAVIFSKLRLHVGDTVWDVGAGTGSVTIECALAAPAGRVYAVECDGEAVSLIRRNAEKFCATNVEVVEGTAPEALEGLPAPDVVFIGGSKGNLRRIVEAALAANPHARIVASAVTTETIAEATGVFNDAPLDDVEAVTVSAARTKKLGGYHLLMAQNPIFIFSGTGTPPADQDESSSGKPSGTPTPDAGKPADKNGETNA